MDIMMPKVDGNEAVKRIREIECEIGVLPEHEVKIVMTTALDDPKKVISSFYKSGATSYLVKPISKQKLVREMRAFGLIV
jgi:two-component system chemotaxis response regulator CheY